MFTFNKASLLRLLLPATTLAITSSVLALEMTTSFSEDEFIPATGGMTLNFDQAPVADGVRLAFFIGSTDVSELIVQQGATEFSYPGDAPPLPPGEQELIVYQVTTDDNWEELTRLPIKVLTGAGYEVSEVTPKLEVAVKAQLAEHTSGDAIPSERQTYVDGEFQAGLETRHRRSNALEIRSSVNINGVTFEEDALRFGELDDDAPKVDLADYLVEAEKNNWLVSVGHVAYGNNPLLMDGIANRGMSALYKINNRFDMSVSAMNGRSIVGWENILGLADFGDNRIAGATFGMELLDRPGGLRAEISYLDGIITSEDNFNVGEVTDAEKNNGIGVRLLGSTETGRLRGELNFVRSRFTNPDDPNLDPDNVDTVQVRTTTDNAYDAQIAYQIVDDYQAFGEQGVNLTATGRYAYFDAFFNTLGAAVDPNRELYNLGLEGNVGEVSFQLDYNHNQDNVDDLISLLTTRTQSWNFNIAVPIRGIYSDEEITRWWVPDLAYSFEHTHQKAVNQPDPILSGFTDPSQLPDQITMVHGLDLLWGGEKWDFGYRFAFSDEDNRQEGREDADFSATENSIAVNVRPIDTLSFNFGLGRLKDRDKGEAITRFTDNYSIAADWQFAPDWLVSAGYSYTDEDDNSNLATRDSTSAQAQLTWGFELPGPAGVRKLPGQWFIRYNLEDQNEDDLEFDFSSSATTWTINTGVSLSLY